MSREFYFYFSGLVSFLLAYILDPRILLQIIIIFGQAHFIITYFYKNKAGRVDGKFAWNFIYFLVLLFILTFFIGFNLLYVNYFIVLTSLVFVIHYFYDELKIFDFKSRELKWFGGFAVLLSYFAVFLQKTFEIKALSVAPIILVSFLLTLYSNYLLYKSNFDFKDKKNLNIYLFVMANILIPLCLIFTDVNFIKVLGFIIVFHYLRWYLYYFDRFSRLEDKKELSFYLDVVLWVHIFVVTIFILYTINTKSGFLFLLFSPIFFYTWTLLHIVLSVRKEDYDFLLNI